MNPGGAYPLVFVNILAGAVTCSGKLSLTLEYCPERIQTETVLKIQEKLSDLLLAE